MTATPATQAGLELVRLTAEHHLSRCATWQGDACDCGLLEGVVLIEREASASADDLRLELATWKAMNADNVALIERMQPYVQHWDSCTWWNSPGALGRNGCDCGALALAAQPAAGSAEVHMGFDPGRPEGDWTEADRG